MNRQNLIGLILGIVVVIFGIGGVIYEKLTPLHPNQDVEYIYSSPGGDIFTFMGHYQQDRVEHKKIDVEGVCASACTYFLGIIPPSDYCASPEALFGFHGVYSEGFNGQTFIQPYSQWVMPLVYPKNIIDILKTHGYDGSTDVDHVANPTGLIWLTGKELGIQPCA